MLAVAADLSGTQGRGLLRHRERPRRPPGRALAGTDPLGDDDAVRDTIENVVQSCLVDDKIIASELGAHIVDYLYIQMYSK